ncbi:unnamed protein product [Lathyrus sativus]|nr:unnamed protein product [Lathyrus sativus]
MKERDWIKVRRKKPVDRSNRFSVWSEKRGKGLEAEKEFPSFFFTEFPESHNVNDMVIVFKDFGIVKEVFIPSWRDKRGRRYGFVRFRKVKNVRLMATKLDSIQIAGTKLHLNVPRFQRDNGAMKRGNIEVEKAGHRKTDTLLKSCINKGRTIAQSRGRSYAQVVGSSQGI